jgi:transposase
MLCPDLRDVRVYLHREPVDMRRQRNGLAALVRSVINEDPFSNCRASCQAGQNA